MKKITHVGILGLLIAAFFVGTPVSQAASNTGSTNTSAEAIVGGTNMPYGIGLNTEFEAALKAANIRCATLATNERKAACVKENEAAIRAKAEAKYKQVPAQDVKRIEFRGEPIGGGRGGSVVDTKKGGEVDAKGDVRPAPAPMGDGKDRNESADFASRFESVITRLVAYVDRFTTLKARIETRAADLSAKGVNVAEAKTAIENGRKFLESAKTEIADAKVSFKEEFSSSAGTPVSASVKAETVSEVKGELFKTEKDVKISTDTKGVVKAIPAPGIRGAMGLGMFTKTKEHIKSAGQFLIQAQYQFLSANSFLTQAEANLKTSN